MKKNILFTLIFSFLLLLKTISYANYDLALEAYNNEDWKLSKKACENSKDDKCLNLLGLIYIKGLGVEIDYSKAVGYFSKAEEMGNKKAMINLGIIYMKGIGTSVDIDKSAKYFNKAYKDLTPYKYSTNNNIDFPPLELKKLSNNNLIAEYTLFYSYYLKFLTLLDLEYGKNLIDEFLINKVDKKYFIVKDNLIKRNLNIENINSKIYEDQKILLLLYSGSFNADKNKFENELNNVINFIFNFNFK